MGLLRFDRAIGTINGINLVFYTPNPYVSGTLVVFLNGQQKDPDLDDGYTETDPALGKFTMKEAPLSSPGCPDVLWAQYENQLEAAGGGADGGIPRIKRAIEVRPVVRSAVEVEPKLHAAADQSDVTPDVSAGEKKPKNISAQNLVPRIAGAEEV